MSHCTSSHFIRRGDTYLVRTTLTETVDNNHHVDEIVDNNHHVAGKDMCVGV